MRKNRKSDKPRAKELGSMEEIQEAINAIIREAGANDGPRGRARRDALRAEPARDDADDDRTASKRQHQRNNSRR